MNSLIPDLVKIDRCKVINMSGSQYVRLPRAMKEENKTQPGDFAVFLRSAKSADTVIRIEKAEATESEKK